MAIPAKLEVTLRITTFPTDVATVENGWKRFAVEADGRVFLVTLRPKHFTAFETLARQYPEWTAAIRGGLGEASADGWILREPAVQVFERKPKATTDAAGA